ncbi:hypothetical protein RRF57_001086 [Xylaria bambusicola]|uniref:Uncharacterized protein n=1 Tax=Xylaria bambusicola TaxID=326684 RepID=A0AAN7YUP5_9PEZI
MVQPVIRDEVSGSRIPSLQAKSENKGRQVSIENASIDEIHQIDLNIGQSALHGQQQTLHEQERARNEAEHESKVLELQGGLKDAQAKTQDLFAKQEKQRFQLNKAIVNSPSKQWTTLALHDNIRDYLERYDQHLRDTASYHLQKLQRELEGNLSRLDEETRRQGEFEQNLLQEYKNTTTWYQHEVQSLQGQKSEKEASIEQLRAEFLNDRQRLYDEHRNELNTKATEYARLTEKQHRKQERLANWYNRRMDEKAEKWRTRLVSVQLENAHLINERN